LTENGSSSSDSTSNISFSFFGGTFVSTLVGNDEMTVDGFSESPKGSSSSSFSPNIDGLEIFEGVVNGCEVRLEIVLDDGSDFF